METPSRRGDLVRLARLVRTFLHKNKSDLGECGRIGNEGSMGFTGCRKICFDMHDFTGYGKLIFLKGATFRPYVNVFAAGVA